jgi:peptide/nickel transport system permease protein
MVGYAIRRFFYMIVLMVVISIVSFIIIQLPPSDFVDIKVAQLMAQGQVVAEAEIESLKRLYGLDQPPVQQFLGWVWRMLQGDLGRSFKFEQPVADLIMERLPLTLAINLLATVLVYAIAVPIGIYSATHQYSIGDYAFTVVGFMGIATPGFLLALALMLLLQNTLGFGAGGLFSPQYQLAEWSIDKVVDMMKHLVVAIVVEALAGTAGLIRVMRGCLLDELRKPYVVTARSKGLDEQKLLFKYPIRIAINPIVSTIGWMLPGIVSGGAIVEIVLSLPTIGPLILSALTSLDMYLAGSAVMVLAFLTIIGSFVSDILLVIVDPRIRYEKTN